jgi:hypothetical protein
MTTTEELAARLNTIEAALNSLGGPELFAATDSSGNPSTVAAGQLIESAWGNAVIDRIVRRYATAAARNTALPTPAIGTVTYVQGNNSVQLRDSTNQWIEPGGVTWGTLGTQAGISGPVTIPGSGWQARSSARKYLLIVQAAVFKGGAAGGITISPNPMPAGMVGVSRRFGTPESGTLTGMWFVNGSDSGGGGALTIQPETGTIDLLGGGYIALVDMSAILAQYT